ncbi:MAG TPA: PP2C family protein-serine/threonine phosphatase [Thermoanaerobaculia bacterium]|nr:PP2C family protein-serine/threonine phosphatase [Thermoanaerobaculia bacterium]
MPPAPERRLPVALALGLGALALAAGLAAARAGAPEWQDGRLPDRSFFVDRFRELAGRVGVRLLPGEPRIALSQASDKHDWLEHGPHGGSPGVLSALGAGVLVEVEREGSVAGSLPQIWTVEFTPAGRPSSLEVMTTDALSFAGLAARPSEPQQAAVRYARALLIPGESLGASGFERVAGNPSVLYAIAGSRPPQYMVIQVPPAENLVHGRRYPGTLASALARYRTSALSFFLGAVPAVLFALGVVAFFLFLVFRRRIDLVNGAVLAALALAVSLPGFRPGPPWLVLAGQVLPAAALALWLLVLWSAGESLMRSTDPGFLAGFDLLRRGRIGPRGGRAIVLGIAAGSGLAGLCLAVNAAARLLPGTWQRAQSLEIPIFSATHSPLESGFLLAAGIMLILALARRFVAPRWRLAAATLAGALFLGPFRFHPVPVEIAANGVLAGLLVWLAMRHGLTSLLTACVTCFLLPAAAFSALHLAWLPASFVATAAMSAGLLGLGVAGLRRPEQVENERPRPPAFMRRLEDERRLRYEVDLLARMQLELLPRSVPQPPGWEIAVRSLLATEAGGDLYDFLWDEEGKLWIAAGDVAGHGYSCSIVQAMTSAALASLIEPGKRPGEVLGQVNRVIRRGGSRRNFTSLALLRLDTSSGEAMLANAGHPFPFLLRTGGGPVTEISLPGLPLGQGPPREYGEVRVDLQPGSLLVFCSDGLFEAANAAEVAYGFDRPREVLFTARYRSAARIVDSLLEDWRRHIGVETPPDDTTVLVIKRLDDWAAGS